MKNIKHISSFSFVIIFFVINSVLAAGATLSLTLVSASHKVGEVFDLTVKVDSIDQAINAVEGNLAFSKNLEVVNISKSGSILKIWVSDPTFSNQNGTLRFSGGLASPGFRGPSGVILHIIFRAKSAGAATIFWQGGKVLANDGQGTDILSSLEGADLVLESNGFVGGALKDSGGIILGLAVIFLIILILIFWRSQHKRQILSRETADVKDVLRRNFDLYRDQIRDQLKDLEDATKNRELNKEEKKKKEKLLDELTKIEEKIEKEIKDVEEKLN